MNIWEKKYYDSLTKIRQEMIDDVNNDVAEFMGYMSKYRDRFNEEEFDEIYDKMNDIARFLGTRTYEKAIESIKEEVEAEMIWRGGEDD